jgi:hypothetical protein
MKRFFLVLLGVFALNSARAEEYFGLRGELFFPFLGGSASAWALPEVGVQFGVDFPNINFGFRASASTLIVTYRLALDAYYVLPVINGSNLYVGAGAGLIGAFANVAGFQAGQTLAEIRGVFGYQSTVTTGFGGRFFIEAIPSFIPGLGGGAFGFTVGLGVNFRS